MSKRNKKIINKNQYPHLSQMQKNYEHKDMDEISTLILNLYSAYGLAVGEVAALNYYLMKNVFEQRNNKKFFDEKLGIKVDELNSEELFQLQNLLLNNYVEKTFRD